jgi:hypothetical protein
MIMNKIFKNTLIYFLLTSGYIFIYVIDIENYFFEKEKKEVESKSKINFIYQQF